MKIFDLDENLLAVQCYDSKVGGLQGITLKEDVAKIFELQQPYPAETRHDRFEQRLRSPTVQCRPAARNVNETPMEV
jgi:hypothetical protein